MPKVYSPLPHEGESEGFDDEYHGVQSINPTEVFRHGTERIGHATGIHPKLHEKSEHDLQIAEPSGDTRDKTTDAQAEGAHLQHQNGQHNDAPSHINPSTLEQIVDIKNKEKRHLHGEADKVRDELGDRHRKAGEVNFVKNTGIRSKGAGGLRHAALEIAPADGAGEEKQHGRNLSGGNVCDFIEYKREHQAGEKRLKDIPERTEDGLFVARDKVSMDESVDEVPIFPEFAPRDAEDAPVRGDGGGPVVGGNGFRRLHRYGCGKFIRACSGIAL